MNIPMNSVWRRRGTDALVKVTASDPRVEWALISTPTKGARTYGSVTPTAFRASYVQVHDLVPVAPEPQETATAEDAHLPSDATNVERVIEILEQSSDAERADVLVALMETDRQLAQDADIIRTTMTRVGGQDTLRSLARDVLDVLSEEDRNDIVEDYTPTNRDVVVGMNAEELSDAVDAREDDLTLLSKEATADDVIHAARHSQAVLDDIGRILLEDTGVVARIRERHDREHTGMISGCLDDLCDTLVRTAR